MNEAERLAEKLENHELTWGYREYSDKAAAELRRLSAINAELAIALSAFVDFPKDTIQDLRDNQNQSFTMTVQGFHMDKALSALEKAKQ